MLVHVTCKYKKDRIKTTEQRWRDRFPHYKSMGAFCCHGNKSFNPICSHFLTPVMLHIKLIKIGQLASEIFKFESVDDGRKMDFWYTVSSPCEPSAQVS